MYNEVHDPPWVWLRRSQTGAFFVSERSFESKTRQANRQRRANTGAAKKTAKSPGARDTAHRPIEIDELDAHVVSDISLQDFDQAPIRATLIGSDRCEVDALSRAATRQYWASAVLSLKPVTIRVALYTHIAATPSRLRSDQSARVPHTRSRIIDAERRSSGAGGIAAGGLARRHRACAIRTSLSTRHHPKNQPVSLRHDRGQIAQSKPNRSGHRPATGKPPRPLTPRSKSFHFEGIAPWAATNTRKTGRTGSRHSYHC